MTSRSKARPEALSKRERQVMDAIYRRGDATAGDVFADIPDAASYNAVRSVLTILEEKGHLTHETRERRYVYRPTVEP
ncbi:MAG: BlaI/MecI/CopY family transcriptional regulator, partial [Thermoanaerobaculia bacterium]